jgi:hypothetical protein
LHTHILVADRSIDEIWRALDGRRLDAHARTAGFLYEARLRGELTRRSGVAWRWPRNGIADMAKFARRSRAGGGPTGGALVERQLAGAAGDASSTGVTGVGDGTAV